MQYGIWYNLPVANTIVPSNAKMKQ
jgi:hypothetical protein